MSSESDPVPVEIGAEALAAIDWDSVPSQDRPPHIRVLPVGAQGQEIMTRVAVIRDSSSNCINASGPVEVSGPKSGSATLTLTTDDGRIAWRKITSEDRGPMAVVVSEPGAFLDVELTRDEPTRIAIYSDGVLIHDYTLHQGKLRKFVVPVGEVTFGLTGPDATTQTIAFSKGQREFVRLD